MKAFLGFALGIITVGVFLIAYGVLSPRVGAGPAWGGDARYLATPASAGAAQFGQPVYVSDRVALPDGYTAVPTQYGYVAAPAPVSAPRAVRTSSAYTSPRTSIARAERTNGRDWMKTALVIGGSSAAGAGVGAIVGGKKGALIGAAIGGGASSLYEAKQR